MSIAVSLMGQGIMQKNSPAIKRSLEKLSTGLRKKNAGMDDTAGLALGDTARSRAAGMSKALSDSQDGISMIQTAGVALEQTQGMLRRMRELAQQATNDALTQQDRGYIQTEINEIRTGITRIAETTQFNRKRILSGDNAVLWSSTDKNIKAVINGGLRTLDRFGQKYAVDGNYSLEVKTVAGKSQVQKSGIFYADEGTMLGDTDNFRGILEHSAAKELTLTQGDGRQAKITLNANDTLGDMAEKLNRAVAVGLGQGEYVDDASKFVSFSEDGTLVVRSVLAGKLGEIALSGNDDLLEALSLKTIQPSQENTYTVTVKDALTDTLIAQDVSVTEGRLSGVIHENVDVEFSPMTGIFAQWDDVTQNFSLTASDTASSAILHLADNTSVFQTGAGEGDVLVSIGDMSASALGLNSVNVMSRESSAVAMQAIDKAIDRVSMQQAKLGAAQKRLEHHISSLMNETEIDSRISDNDSAKEILAFTKMNILMQSNSAMLSQANQSQQNVLMLFR